MTGLPYRLLETWNWFIAVIAFDYDDHEPLAELIRTEAIPPEFAGVVADIVTGIRKPQPKRGVKLKIPAAERMKVAAGMAFILGMDDLLLSPENVQKFAEFRHPEIEPITMRRERQALKRKDIEDFAESLDVSTETVKKLVRELKARIDRWPVV